MTIRFVKFIIILGIITNLVNVGIVNAGSLSVTKQNITLNESGGYVEYLLNVTPEPTDQLTIYYFTDLQCLVAFENTNYTNSGTIITNGKQFKLKVKANNDSVQESQHTCKVSYQTQSPDPEVNNLFFEQNITIIDDGDGPAPIYTITASSNSSYITEGSSEIYTYKLTPTQPPRDPLIISASSTDQCSLISPQGNIRSSYQEKTISAGSINTISFSVVSNDDAIVEGLHSCTITHGVITDDTKFTMNSISNQIVPILDNESEFSSLKKDTSEIVDRFEFGLLDAGDANADGIPDSRQPNVQSFINHNIGKRNALVVESVENSQCNKITNIEVTSEAQLERSDNDFDYPIGLMSFIVECANPGDKAKITILLDENYETSDLSVRKFIKSNYYEVSDFEFGLLETDQGEVTTISYIIEDGGDQDNDGKKNASIEDPIGLAVPVNNSKTGLLGTINQPDDTVSNQSIIIPLVVIVSVGAAISLLINSRKVKNTVSYSEIFSKEEDNDPSTEKIRHF